MRLWIEPHIRDEPPRPAWLAFETELNGAINDMRKGATAAYEAWYGAPPPRQMSPEEPDG